MTRLAAAVLLFLIPALLRAETISEHLVVYPGPVNGVLVGAGDDAVSIYGLPEKSDRKATTVLLTHHRRDVVTSAVSEIEGGAKAVAPEAERDLVEKPKSYWEEFWTKRFHDYAQQSTKVLVRSVKVDRWVKDGDEVSAGGTTFRVLDTPGFTRGAVSYVAKIDGKTVAFTGDLIYGDGKLFDLYSFQDAIPEAKVGGYHGHAGRFAMLIPSLRKIAAAKPDIIIPARGPVIRNPQQAIKKLIDRVQAYYRNYLSTNALNWYFKEERMTIKGRRVLGQDADVELMPYSLHQETPDWIWENSTSRMLISDDGHGFLLDCGYQRVIDGVKKLMDQKLISKVDGIFVTHYHDDHTNMVQAASEEFDCPIYSTVEYQEILENPGGYHMPATTHNPMKNVRGLKSPHRMKWKEYELEFRFYPGQTFYHGALLVRRNGGTPVFFVGDAFAPSGMDDYCLLNRNLLHEDSGYLFCLKEIRKLGPKYWLINEHIPHIFRFSPKELDYLEGRYRKRIDIVREMVPWDDPNYGVDEQWAVLYPRAVEAKVDDRVKLDMRITNHSPIKRKFSVRLNHVTPPQNGEIILKPRQSGAIPFEFTVKDSGTLTVTADVTSDGMEFRSWADAIIRSIE